MKYEQTFTIDRATWRNGGDKHDQAGAVRLKNSLGFKCCLGFVCEQLGIPSEYLESKVTPESLKKAFRFLVYKNK